MYTKTTARRFIDRLRRAGEVLVAVGVVLTLCALLAGCGGGGGY